MATTNDPIVIVSAARTPMGGFQGDFAPLAASDLGAVAIKAAVAGAPDRVNVRSARVHRRVHVGELALHQLKLADGLPELFALVHVRQHGVHAGAHDSQWASGQHGALEVEP